MTSRSSVTDYDELNRVRSRRGNHGQETIYRYDLNGNLKEIERDVGPVSSDLVLHGLGEGRNDLYARGHGLFEFTPTPGLPPLRLGSEHQGSSRSLTHSATTANPRNHGSRWAMSNVRESNICIISA